MFENKSSIFVTCTPCTTRAISAFISIFYFESGRKKKELHMQTSCKFIDGSKVGCIWILHMYSRTGKHSFWVIIWAVLFISGRAPGLTCFYTGEIYSKEQITDPITTDAC